jgi:hypothetical protein
VVADQLNGHFTAVVSRVVARMDAEVQGVPIAEVEFVPRRQQLCSTGEDDHSSP